MAVLNKGHDFSDGDQVTADKLDAAVDSATFAAGAVDNASTQLSGGAIIVKDAGVTAAKLATDSVTTTKILDANVTTAKIADANVTTAKIADANVTTAKIAANAVTTDKIQDITSGYVLGKGHGQSTGSPQEILIDNDLSNVNADHNTVVSAKAVKDYVDNKSATTQSLTQNGYQVFPSGLIIQWGVKTNVSESSNSVAIFAIPFPNACLNATATARNSSGGNTASFDYFSQVVSFNTTTLTLKSQNLGSSTDSTYWQAIGY